MKKRREEKRREEKRREEHSRTYLLSTVLFSSILILSVSGGCDENSEAASPQPAAVTSPISVESEALVVTERAATDEKIAKVKEDGMDGDAPTPIFNLWWFGEEAKKAPVSSSVLTLQLYNHQKEAARAHVMVTFNGLLTEPVVLDLGEFLVDGDREMFIEIPATEIPLQTTEHVCSAYASAELVFETADHTWRTNSSSEIVYYQHKKGYEKLRFFKQKVFEKQFGGAFIDHVQMGTRADDPDSYFNKSLGRKKVKKKDAVGVTTTALEDVVINRPAKGGPVLVGISIGSGPVDEAGLDRIVESSTEDTTEDSVEVTHELL